MPEPWASILAGLTGPYGVIMAEGVVIYFLWLEQERTEVQQAAQSAIDAATDAVSASKKARRKVLELELQLRRRQ